MVRYAFFLVPASLLAGCFPAGLNSWQKRQLESRTAADVSDAVADTGTWAGGVESADAARGTYEDCYTGYGGCEVCWTLDGDVSAGTLEAALVAEEGSTCTAALTLNDVRYEYTIDERTFAGSWDLREEEQTEEGGTMWNFAWTGTKDATLVVTGSESYDGTYDSSFTMNSGGGVADGDGNTYEWDIDYDYTGFLDRDWNVVAAMARDESLTGTVTGSDGTICAISGTRYDVVVDCDAVVAQ